MRLTIYLAPVMLAASVSSVAIAAPAVNLTSPGIEYNGGLYTLGFEFSVAGNYSIDSLGVYDNLGDGLTTGANIGLWDMNGNLLASTTIAAGGGTLDGLFRYNAITPYALTSGTHYIVGAFTQDLATSLNTNQGGVGAVNPLVTIHRDRFSPFDSAFGFPSDTNNHVGAWLGGNFNLVEAAVPEPATWAIMVLGFGLLGATMRRRAGAVRVHYA